MGKQIHYLTKHCRNYRLYQIIVQIKVVENKILYKKVSGCTWLSSPVVEQGGSLQFQYTIIVRLRCDSVQINASEHTQSMKRARCRAGMYYILFKWDVNHTGLQWVTGWEGGSQIGYELVPDWCRIMLERHRSQIGRQMNKAEFTGVPAGTIFGRLRKNDASTCESHSTNTTNEERLKGKAMGTWCKLIENNWIDT